MSIHGHHPEPPTPEQVIHQWSYTGDDIPSGADCLKIHINFWLLGGNPPANNEEVELIVSNVDSPHALFLPIILNQPPTPSITITATAREASGKVSPPQLCNSNYKVALYALTDIWYVQPNEDSPDIEINSDCTWHSTTNAWEVLAAHLVTAEFSSPPTIGLSVPTCPPFDVTDPDVMATACFP
jgi:hypothetical protein